MKKALIALFAMFAVVVGFGLSRSQSSAAAPSSTASAEVCRPELTQAADQLQLNTPNHADCEQNATSDAESCVAGGWIFDPEVACCRLGQGHYVGHWHKGTQVKCCGGCLGV